MQTTTKIIFAVCSIVTVETLAPANAQYYPPPGYGHATVIGHGMDVPRGGRFRAETAHPTKVRAVVAGTPRMDAHPVTPYRVETARPTDMEGEYRPQTYLRKTRRARSRRISPSCRSCCRSLEQQARDKLMTHLALPEKYFDAWV